MDKLGPYELNQIYTGDAKELSKAIPDESVDLIFTDPEYESFGDYQWLAKTATRILKPNKACLVWCGIGYLPQTLGALIAGGLSYKWQLVALRPTGVKSSYCMNKVFSNWRSLLWFEKGKSSPVLTISDVGYSNDSRNNLHHGSWDKSFRSVTMWLYRFTDSSDIVVDFFTGGAVVPAVCKQLGRSYLAFEIKPDMANLARQRVLLTQPPLFLTRNLHNKSLDLTQQALWSEDGEETIE